MKTITLYHGTAHDFDRFTLSSNLLGEPNAALGIHLTEKPDIASTYAERASNDVYAVRPRVLIVEADVDRVCVVNDQCSFYGRDVDDELDLNIPRDDFLAARDRLMAEGFSALAVDIADDDLIGAWVVFDPSRLRIVGELDLDAAMEMEGIEVPDINYEAVELFPGLKDCLYEQSQMSGP